MRARLDSMTSGQEFHFLCDPKMDSKMDRVIALAGGEVTGRDKRSYGIVVSVRKN